MQKSMYYQGSKSSFNEKIGYCKKTEQTKAVHNKADREGAGVIRKEPKRSRKQKEQSL